MDAPMVHVGVSLQTIKEITNAILAVLKTQNIDNKTKIVAIKAIETAARVENTTISNCNFTGK